MIKELVFNGKAWVQKLKYYVSTSNGNGGAWLWDYDASTGKMSYEDAGNGYYKVLPTNTLFDSNTTKSAVVNMPGGLENSFRRIDNCPAHPENEGKWVLQDDVSLVNWGGVKTS